MRCCNIYDAAVMSGGWKDGATWWPDRELQSKTQRFHTPPHSLTTQGQNSDCCIRMSNCRKYVIYFIWAIITNTNDLSSSFLYRSTCTMLYSFSTVSLVSISWHLQQLLCLLGSRMLVTDYCSFLGLIFIVECMNESWISYLDNKVYLDLDLH